MEQLWDISQLVKKGIPVWPNDIEYQSQSTWEINKQCPVNVSQITMSTHTGTHADAPLHYDPSGQDSADVDLTYYIGPCIVIDASGANGLVKPEDIETNLPAQLDRVLIRTFKRFPHDKWANDYTSIAAETIDLLASRGAILIGVDSPSLDPLTSKTLDAHNRVRHHNMAILEGLVLDKIKPGSYELIAPPLKLSCMDASPVRALLRREG